MHMNIRTGCLLLAAMVNVPVSCPAQCDPLTVKHESSNWWWGAFGNCKHPGGPTDRNAIFDCAWNQVPATEQLSCLKDQLHLSEQTRQAIDNVAAANGPPGSCDQMMVKYDGSHWWWGAFGNCVHGGGITDRNAIFECAWSQVPNSDKSDCLKTRLRATEFTRQGIDDVAARNGPPNNCDQLMRKYDGSNWWRGAFGSCKRAGGSTDRSQILACAWAQVPPPDNQTCLEQRLAPTEQTRKAIDDVLAFNEVVGSNSSFAPFNTCANPASDCPESCDLPTDGSAPDGYFEHQIPQTLLDTTVASFDSPAGHNIGANEGRLRSDLRTVARLADPMNCTLPLAAIANGLGGDDNEAMGQALADLSVTGRRAFAAFKQAKKLPTYCTKQMPALASLLPANCPMLSSMPKRAELVKGCQKALDRAYTVANFLRTGQNLQTNPDKVSQRNNLHWIAVSGEDDAPHRPVNVPSSDFPQYDLDVLVEAPLALLGQPPLPPLVTVSTRYVIAQSRPPAQPAITPVNLALRAEPEPIIGPDAEILIFVHGMDSRAEEANDIIKALFKRMAGSRKNLVVISMDLPTSGYATNLNYDQVSPLGLIGGPKVTLLPVPVPIPPELYGPVVPVFLAAGLPPPPPIVPPMTPIPDFGATGQAPLLDFIETFVVRFVETLDRKVPITGNIKAVIGGSLGGNISFRLGRRPSVPWLPETVVWSPASIWDSLGEGPAPGEPWNMLKHLGPRDAWQKANNRDPNDPNDLGPKRTGLRAAFFGSWDQAIVPVLIPKAQSDTWTSENWPCHKSAIVAARLDRQETYDPNFQSWHWRLAAEQLLYSHQSMDATTHMPRYLLNYKPMLLACGTEDEVPFNNICSATQKTVPHMIMTPGKAIFFQNTGHSVDNERRDAFAKEIDDFLALE
jgi:pimeloyl-ACP methyl ester carboxylesterase